eukprot:363663-Chlamydomonas_euryale.AAC.4
MTGAKVWPARRVSACSLQSCRPATKRFVKWPQTCPQAVLFDSNCHGYGCVDEHEQRLACQVSVCCSIWLEKSQPAVALGLARASLLRHSDCQVSACCSARLDKCQPAAA